LLDGAHNPDGARSLLRALETRFADKEVTLVLGLFKDKAWWEMCRILAPRAARVFLAPLPSERTANPEEVREFCRAQWPSLEIRICGSSAEALDQARAFPFVAVAGSLYLVGEVTQQVGLGATRTSEMELNEWDANRDRAKSA
jgi:dihydrofolate synthase/folylpolyglutamate synthase